MTDKKPAAKEKKDDHHEKKDDKKDHKEKKDDKKEHKEEKKAASPKKDDDKDAKGGALASVDDLKKFCTEKGLYFSSKANKTDLQAVVAEYEKYNGQKVDDLKKECTAREIPVSGSKSELVARLLLFDRYNAMDEVALRAKCRKDGKSDKGTKKELVHTMFTSREIKIKKTTIATETKAEVAHTAAGTAVQITETKVVQTTTTVVKSSPTIKIASWNIANFTADSRHKRYPEIAKLIENFDIIAMQEVLEKEVLEKMKGLLPGWDYVASFNQVGRVRKEHYGIMYRTNRFKVLASGQFDDTARDVLEREPFAATFKCNSGFDFTLITIHVLWGGNVGKRREELTHLKEVISAAIAQNKEEKDVFLMGDFNFDPTDKGWEEFKAMGFRPIILPPAKTTVGDVSLYDNIWFSEKATGASYANECGVIEFDKTMYPGDTLKARNEISDHRPVWGSFYAELDADKDVYGDLQKLKI